MVGEQKKREVDRPLGSTSLMLGYLSHELATSRMIDF